MAKKSSTEMGKKNIKKAAVRVRELPSDISNTIPHTLNKPLYCVVIDEEILKTPSGNIIFCENERAMRELSAEIDYSDVLDTENFSLYNLLCTQFDFYEKDRSQFSIDVFREMLWNDSVLRPCAGPEGAAQFKYLKTVFDFLSEYNLKYANLPQIPFDCAEEFLGGYINGYDEFEKILTFVTSFTQKLNPQQLTVFVTTTCMFSSPILGLMLAVKKINAHEFAVIYLTMHEINSKIWGDISRKEEQRLLKARTLEADIMIRYLNHFSPNQKEKVMRPLNVFLCHSSEDKPSVRNLYDRLDKEVWIDPWLDERKILPGQDWDIEIKKAVRTADIVIVCLSNVSVSKEGYVQKEIKHSLDIADEKPEGTIFIIPLKLESCDVPHRLSAWQWVNYSEGEAYNLLLQSLKTRAQALGIDL